MKKTTIMTIAKKEFMSFLNSPLGYTIIVPFLLISTFLYIRMAFSSGEASMRPFFDLLPWFLLLLSPAISMRLLTDEFRQNTIEVLFAHPVSEFAVVFGKFIGASMYYLLILLTTIGLPMTVIGFSNADPGQILGQYIGAFLVGSTFLSIGLAASAYVKNSISSFLLGAAISFVFIIIGLDFIAMLIPYPFSRFVQDLSILNRSESIARGVLDIRDIVFFLTLIFLSIMSAVYKLSERKLVENHKEKQKLTFAFGLVLTIGLLFNVVLLSYPVRIDLTRSRLFTLSQGTRDTLKSLPDIVTFRLYASRDLPTQMQGVYREATDLLKDYQRLGKNIKIIVIDPGASFQTASEARTAGIEEIQFNKVGSGKFEVQSGFLGLSIQYGDKTESISFIQDTTDFEYQVTRRIRKLTNPTAQTIGLLTNGYASTTVLRKLLETQYTIETIGPMDNSKLDTVRSLIVVDSGDTESTAGALLSSYIARGGKVLYLGSGITVNPQMLTAEKSPSNLGNFLKEYGGTLNNDLVFDSQLGELLAFGQGNQRYIAPYPFWIRSIPFDEKFQALSTIKSVIFPWSSSITFENKEGVKQTKLLGTTQNGGVLKDTFTISPQSIGALIPSGEQTLAAAFEKDSSRIIAVGTNRIAEDQYLQESQDNAVFLSNAVDWLSSDDVLASIPAKSQGRAVFVFRSPYEAVAIQYGNLIIPPIAVILFAIVYLRRRRILTKRIL